MAKMLHSSNIEYQERPRLSIDKVGLERQLRIFSWWTALVSLKPENDLCAEVEVKEGISVGQHEGRNNQTAGTLQFYITMKAKTSQFNFCS